MNDTAAKYAYQDSAEKRLARVLLTDSVHLGIENIEVLKNTVSASSSKLVAFNTLTQAMESYWHGDPINPSEEALQAKFLVEFWDALVGVRREFGRLGKTERQNLRGTSMAGTALSIHGVIAVADAVYQQGLDPASVLAPLAEPVYLNGEALDYFSYANRRVDEARRSRPRDGHQRSREADVAYELSDQEGGRGRTPAASRCRQGGLTARPGAPR